MRAKDAINAIQAELAAPIVFASRKKGTIRFCADYLNLNVEAILNFYSIPHKGKCINFNGNFKIVSALYTKAATEKGKLPMKIGRNPYSRLTTDYSVWFEFQPA